MRTKKLMALLLTSAVLTSTIGVPVYAGETKALKIVEKPGDLSANGSRIGTPWNNRNFGVNLMFRSYK